MVEVEDLLPDANAIRADELERAAAEIAPLECLSAADGSLFGDGYEAGYRAALARIVAMLRLRAAARRALALW